MTTPTEIRLKQRDRILDVVFDSGLSCSFPCAFLRAFTPSADENRRPLAKKLASLKQHCQVNISDIEQVGHYAVKLRFDEALSADLEASSSGNDGRQGTTGPENRPYAPFDAVTPVRALRVSTPPLIFPIFSHCKNG